MTDFQAASQPVNFRKAAFLQSASAIENAPTDVGSEVAFAGRSNSGKSSAINTLTAVSYTHLTLPTICSV